MTLAMLGAAALLALWLIMRGGLKMSRGQATSILAVVVVVGIVAGAAWFKSQRSEVPAGESGNPTNPAPVAQAAQPAAEPASTVAEGELCPEPVPTTQPAVAHADGSATVPPTDATLPRLVDLGAKKCIPCKKMAPILDTLRDHYAGRLRVEFIDVWENRSAAQPYGIRVIPTQILYDRDGKELWRHEGFISKEDLQKLFAEKVGVPPDA
ncbi:MAG: thioredoxin family protein [Planctomycetota bacterium]